MLPSNAPAPLDIVPEHQQQLPLMQQHSVNLQNYHGNVFTSPATVSPAAAIPQQEPQQVGGVSSVGLPAAAATNGIFENGKVCIILPNTPQQRFQEVIW